MKFALYCLRWLLRQVYEALVLLPLCIGAIVLMAPLMLILHIRDDYEKEQAHG